MLEITPSASRMVRDFLAQRGLQSAVRVTLEGGG